MNSITKELDKVKKIRDMVLYNADGYATLPNEEVNLLIAIANQSLQRLESIDNAEPSEALECLEWLSHELKTYYEHLYITLRDTREELISKKKKANEHLEVIKQALLKAQEPKHYLKWEDLEFKDYEQEISVLLNGNKYSVKYTLLPDDDFYMVWIYKENKCIFSLGGKYLEDKQFFNDLHLEMVEE